MYRPVELGNGASHFAIAETALPIAGDSWFWTDDNAKVLEFLSRPELWQRFPRQTNEILHFVRAMCHGPLIFRRVSPPRLEPTETRGTLSGYRHSLMDVKYDLPRGEVIAGLRFHDERNRDNLLMAGNYVEFTHRQDRFKLEVASAISDVDARQHGHTLTLRHSGDLHFESRRKRLRLGRIAYTYSIDARSMLIDVEVALEIEPGVAVTDVVLTIGHDQLGRMRYQTIATNIMPASRTALSRRDAQPATAQRGGRFVLSDQATPHFRRLLCYPLDVTRSSSIDRDRDCGAALGKVALGGCPLFLSRFAVRREACCR